MAVPTIVVPLLGIRAEEEWCVLCRTFRDRLHCVIDVQMPDDSMTQMIHDWALIVRPTDGFANTVGYVLRYLARTTTDPVYNREGTGPKIQRLIEGCTTGIPRERIVTITMDATDFENINQEWDEFQVSLAGMRRWTTRVWNRLPPDLR